MKLRALRRLGHGEGWVEIGQVYEVDDRAAISAMESGFAAPAPEADLKPFRPDLPPDGVSIGEAYLRHVRDYPPLVEPFKEAGLSVTATGSIAPGRYRVAPKCEWLSLGKRQSGRRITLNPYMDDQWLPSPSEYFRAHGRPPPTTQERLTQATRDVIFRMARYFFVQRLMSGELIADGVWEEDLKKLTRTKIAKDWWRRNILIVLGRDAIFEKVRSSLEDRQGRVRRWSDVRVWNAESAAARREEWSASGETPADARSGRPSRRDEIREALAGLMSRGESVEAMSNKELAAAIRVEANVPTDAKGFSDDTILSHLKDLLPKHPQRD